ncbi:MAG: hypothetical protein JWQ09_3876 [Segetibacter sp.]|nr:hypothetical protein [Segetibacter sp.]
MKTLKYLSIVLAGLFLFVACQKEFSVDSGYAGSIATGSLLDTAGNCKNITVNGSYITDSTLTDNNYVTVQVNFATGGSYKIFSDTQNGFYFQDSGYIPAGLQNIKLKATGRPILAKQTIFQVAFDTTFCSFTVTVIGNTPAAYTLVGSPGSCSSADVQGTYTTSTALTASNKVNLQVNVTALGSYNVNTGAVGGMTFSGTGNFTTFGAQTITLQGSGTPTTAGTNTIPVTAGGSNCNFNVTVTAGPTVPTNVDNASDTAWQFTAGGKNYHGPFYDVYDTTESGASGIIFNGITSTSRDTAIDFGSFYPTGTLQLNTPYSSKSGLAAFYFTDYATDTSGADIYKANPKSASYPNPTEDIQFTYTYYDSASGIVTGTFAGTALNAAGATVQITNGKFRAKVR